MGEYCSADMMPESCIDPSFYQRRCASENPADACVLLIGMYLEDELPPDVSLLLEEHVDRCPCCARQLEELSEVEACRNEADRRICAVCPPAGAMDSYVFDRAMLTGAEIAAIETHLHECPLCREEADWLRNLGPAPVPLSRRPRWHQWIRLAGAVAAVIVFALLAVILYHRVRTMPQEAGLRSLAVVKEPQQIDYSDLARTSRALPAPAAARWEQAAALVKAGDFRRASPILKELVAEYPQHSGSVFLLAYCCYRLNEPQMAYELCTKAEAILPHSYQRCMALVHLALLTGHYQRAAEEITALHHNLPDNAEVNRLYERITSIHRGF